MQYKLEKPVRATVGIVKYQCTIEWRNGKFIVDEPAISGGKDTGPDHIRFYFLPWHPAL
jgi:putative redox protein